MSSPPNTLVQEFRAAARAFAEGLRTHEDEYTFTISWYDDYGKLFDNDPSSTNSPIEELPTVALKSGRVILHAGGGTGKSTIFHQLFRLLAAGDEQLPFLVDLRLDGVGKQASLPPSERLLAAANPSTNETTVGVIAAEIPVIIFVDGLNEVGRPKAEEILRQLDKFVSANPQVGIIVSDRLSRRPITDNWRIASIDPLYGDAGLRGIAFWRDLVDTEAKRQADPDSQESTPSLRTVALHTTYLKQIAPMTDIEIELASSAARIAYWEYESRVFPRSLFIENASESVYDELRTAGVLTDVPGTADQITFSHHLHHDLLAARDVAKHPEFWEPAGLDRLTFTGSSFDALAGVADAISSQADADAFLRAVYDWNPYAVAQVLASGAFELLSPLLQIAIPAMLCERRYEPLKGTVVDATDALRLILPLVPPEMLAATNESELIAAVSSVFEPADDRGEAWLDLFTLASDSDFPESAVDAIAETDSLQGWTAANVARRTQLSRSQTKKLRWFALNHPDKVVRWRAVHALGSHASKKTAAVLRESLVSESDPWVRRGALRALIELAARARPEVQTTIVAQLAAILHDRADANAADRIVTDFGRFVVLTSPPAGWVDALKPIVNDMWLLSTTAEQQEYWESIAGQLKASEAEAPSPT